MNPESLESEKKLLGVSIWLSSLLKTDVKIVRIVFIVSTILSIGTMLIIYLILWAIKEWKIV